MAIQNDLFRFSGTLGEVNYYQVGGKYFSRKSGGGFTSKAIKNKASMQKVREFNTEFGRCSAAKKAFRIALEPYLGEIRSRDLHSNMMRLFLELKNLDPVNPIGKRSISEGFKTKEGARLIHNFSFLPELDFSTELRKSKGKAEIKISELGDFGKEADQIELSYAVLHCDFESADFFLDETITMSVPGLPLNMKLKLPEVKKDFLWVLELKYFCSNVMEKRVLKVIKA